MEAKAHKVQSTHGVKSNRNVEKPDFVSPHRRSKVKSIKDPRVATVQLRLTHPSKSVQTKTIEYYRIEAELRKWKSEGWQVDFNN